MKRIFLNTLVVGSVVAILFLYPEASIEANSPADVLNKDLESRVERLETLVQKLSLNLERMQMADKDAAVNYDYENGFSVLRFYQLAPFVGKLKKCVVLPKKQPEYKGPGELLSGVVPSEGPTCRLYVERESDGKVMVIDNFRTVSGSKEKLDQLLKQNTCNFPNDIWSLRHSALYD